MPDIIVEDGSNVDDANSYVDIAYLDLYASERGLSLPTELEDKQIFLIKAFDYLEARRSDYQGYKAVEEQKTQWPRTEVYIDHELLDSDAIPVELKKAQCQLVVEQQQRTLLYPKPRTSSVEGFVTQKTVGPLTKKFSLEGKGVSNPNAPILIASVEIFLKPLTSCCGQSWKETLRV